MGVAKRSILNRVELVLVLVLVLVTDKKPIFPQNVIEMKYSVITQNVEQKGGIILDGQLVRKATGKYSIKLKTHFNEI